MLPLKDNVPTRTFPLVTVGLIVANAAVFGWERRALNLRTAEYGYYPCDVVGSCVGAARHFERLPWYESVFTAMFMHGGWAHIGGNMLFLWIFGNNVEDAMGRVRFLGFYLLGGIAAMAAQTAVTVHYAGPAAESVPNIGASGAIAAVLGAYFVLLPRARVLTWIVFVIREVPAFLFLAVWFGFQLWEGGFGLTHPQDGGGVAFFAHVGGFVFGALTVHLFAIRRPLRPRW
ncbi:MAG TPA: rhomboid family intramembrane serine protease [Gaiellaceae bacterium]|nr:rhomboid family intramembrane serine protease [Gaiellaceae bacterium]